jgi:hypothetical protein
LLDRELELKTSVKLTRTRLCSELPDESERC